MKSNLFFASVFGLFMVFVSCNNRPTRTLDDKIQDSEGKLYDEYGQFDQKIAEQLVQYYMKRVDSIPTDSSTPDYLFKAADISINLSNNSRTLGLLNRFAQDYPKHEKAPMSLFLKAFVFENQIMDTAQAHRTYQEFIKRYPDHDFAGDARIAIKNMGKTPEELIREFETMNKAK